MLDLLGLEVGDVAGELGVAAIGEVVALRLVVAVDLGLDRDGARHRRLRPEQRRADAERIARDVPQRVEQGRPDAAAGDEVVEHREVARLLVLHPRDRGGDRAAPAHDGELAGIDPRRAVLAGVVDADHRLGRISHSAAPPIRVEKIALYPAIETPNRLHAAASQRIIGVASADVMKSVPAAKVVPVHACGPAHQWYSTPAWKPPIAADVSTATAARATSARLLPKAHASSPRPSAATCGQRCHRHISHGGR